jgi:hypothetical protein
MKLDKAQKLIEGKKDIIYQIHFETVDRIFLRGDSFPENNGDVKITSLEEAVRLYEAFAKVDPKRYVNIRLFYREDEIFGKWNPLEGYPTLNRR